MSPFMHVVTILQKKLWDKIHKYRYVGSSRAWIDWNIHVHISSVPMMKSSNWNLFRDAGPLCGVFTGHRWIPRTKARDAELWCFLWSAPWINGWVNNREAGDFRRHRVPYDVIVMPNSVTTVPAWIVINYPHIIPCSIYIYIYIYHIHGLGSNDGQTR